MADFDPERSLAAHSRASLSILWRSAYTARPITPLDKSVPANDTDFFLLGKHELWNTQVQGVDIEAGHNLDLEDEVVNRGGGIEPFK